MHPILNEGVEIGKFHYKNETDNTHYYATSSKNKTYEISEKVFQELCNADGTRALMLPQKLISELIECDIIRTTRYVKDNDGCSAFTFFSIGERFKKCLGLCTLLNSLLPLASLSIFILGCFVISGNNFPVCHCCPLLFFILFSVSILAHEMGHIIAGTAYGISMGELRIYLRGAKGAYVTCQKPANLSKKKSIQFSLAGLEVNLFLSGLFTLLSTFFLEASSTLIAAATLNIVMLITNLLPGNGHDGEKALSLLIGVKSVSGLAKRCLFNEENRRHFLSAGRTGRICLGLFAFSVVSEIIVSRIGTMTLVISAVYLFM